MLNSTQAQGTSWNQLKKKLKYKFGVLLYSDLAYSEIKQENMFTHLQIKLGLSKDDFDKMVAGL